MTFNELVAALSAWKQTHASHMKKLHEIVMNCLKHTAEHRDATIFDHVLTAIPLNHGRKLTEWLALYSPIVPKDSTHYKFGKDRPFNFAEAEVTPFYSLGKQTNETEFDAEKYIRSVIAKVSKEKERDNFDIPHIQALVSKLAELTSQPRQIVEVGGEDVVNLANVA